MSQSPDPWVAVADRLPPPGVRCLVYAPRRDRDNPELMAVASRTAFGWWPLPASRDGDVTHWTDLPRAPA